MQSWWERSKRLLHGTLCCLWYEELQGSEQNVRLVFGVISERKVDALAAARPRISLRY